jgi:hypothetical protein
MRPSRGRIALHFLLPLAVTCASLGAQPLDRSGSGALTGTFVSADTLQVVVRTDDDAVVRFLVEDQASVPAGLAPGMRVTVRYAVGDDGRYRVVRVGVASYPPEPGSTMSLPAPPAEVASPPPPAASPSPPPTTTAAPPPPSVARGETGGARPARAAGAAGLRAKGRVARPAAPVVEEPPASPEAAPPAALSAESSGVSAPSGERPTAHLLKLGGLLLMAGGLLALAYAFLRGYA